MHLIENSTLILMHFTDFENFAPAPRTEESKFENLEFSNDCRFWFAQ